MDIPLIDLMSYLYGQSHGELKVAEEREERVAESGGIFSFVASASKWLQAASAEEDQVKKIYTFESSYSLRKISQLQKIAEVLESVFFIELVGAQPEYSPVKQFERKHPIQRVYISELPSSVVDWIAAVIQQNESNAPREEWTLLAKTVFIEDVTAKTYKISRCELKILFHREILGFHKADLSEDPDWVLVKKTK